MFSMQIGLLDSSASIESLKILHGSIMSIPRYNSITILSYSPVAKVRLVSAAQWSIFSDTHLHGPQHRAAMQQLAAMTKQPDPALRLQFAFWAIDKAPSEELRGLVPLETFILHYARGLPAWDALQDAPALNIVVLDWPDGIGGYTIRAFLMGSDAPMTAEGLPYFYESLREKLAPEMQRSMPAPFDTSGRR